MELTGLDYAIIVGYFTVALAVGLYFARRAGSSLEEYIVSGRSLPWWIAGTSMVATTFAADTPLAVTSLVVSDGISGNWLWWNMAIGGVLTVFLFARLWRRAGVMTDVELAEVRYSGKPAAFLRGFRAVYVALFLNSLIIAWVTIAMVTVLKVCVGWDPQVTILVLIAVTGLYAVLSGLWGVVITDFLQFIMAMVGCIVLAWLCMDKIGGLDGLHRGLNDHFGMDHEVLNFIPSFGAKAWLPFNLFCIYLGVLWWASWYPGAEPGGGGYVVQRMASCKNEKHSVLATLWFTVAHYCIRPWPWIFVALAALVMYPELKGAKNPGEGFPMMMSVVLPAGWRGLLLVSFFAAYMSTLSTQINWATSYLVSDFYKRFLVKSGTDRHYAMASRITTVIVLLFGVGMTFLLLNSEQISGRIDRIWKLLLLFGAGTGSVLILRWYWWRVSAWSEIASMLASALGACYLYFGSELADEVKIVYVTIFSIAAWIVITMLTPPTDEKKLLEFYRKVRPGGVGWKPIRRLAPEVKADQALHLDFLNWILGIVVVFSALFGIGRFLLGHRYSGLGLLVMAVLAGWLISRNLVKTGWAKEEECEEQPASRAL